MKPQVTRVLRWISYLTRPFWFLRKIMKEVELSVEEVLIRTGVYGGNQLQQNARIRQNNDFSELQDWGRQSIFFVNDANKAGILSTLHATSSDAAELIVLEANLLCDHVYNLLGSGRVHLGQKIDWHSDFKNNYRWSPNTYYRRIRQAPYPGGYDIKVPWELSRFQHLTRLGQAYWLTVDEKYPREFVAQLEDWMVENQRPWGVNWACTMDVAIRVVNWLWGYHFMKESPSLTDEYRLSFHSSLHTHGRHIWRNLENQGGVNNNHYLANLVGLIFVGILCPEFKEAATWRDFGVKELWRELFKQTYVDGGSFEASTAYHRLATELFLSAALLCQLNLIRVPVEVLCRIEKMLEFVMNCTSPDGTMPQVGDSDNGRLHRLAVWKPEELEREWDDYRYLLAIGSFLYEREDFRIAAGNRWQEAVWLCGNLVSESRNNSLTTSVAERSHAFAKTGIYVMRHNSQYMLIDAGTIGQGGCGGHAHNDLLAFELHANGQKWIVDSGSYCYTSDYRARNRARSTSSHNTVMIDNEEINQFNIESLFSLEADSGVRVKKWLSDSSADILIAEHYGYRRLPGLVTHERLFYFDKASAIWVIRDRITGSGRHTLNWEFVLAPKVVISKKVSELLCLHSTSDKGKRLWIYGLGGGILKKQEAIVSPSYGIGQVSSKIEFSWEATLPVEKLWAFITGIQTPSAHFLQITLEKAEKAWSGETTK